MSAVAEETALARIESITAIDLFKPEVIDPILGRIREEVTSQAKKLDISTPGNRSELASLAYKVARSKTFIDGQRKTLVSDEKKRLAKIDAEGRRIWDELESLQEEVRKPLTDWENAEKMRVAEHEHKISVIEDAGNCAKNTPELAGIEELILVVETVSRRDWQEFSTRAADAKRISYAALSEAKEQAKRREEEAVELSRLRAEAAAREQKDREERIARDAKEKAEREAKAREEQAAREVAEREARLEREARQREHAAIIAKEEAEMKAKKAETDRIAAEERHEREKQAAIVAERKRVADEALRVEAEAKARERDKAHKAEVNNAALLALVAAGLSNEDAKLAITAIAKGLIPNVKVVY